MPTNPSILCDGCGQVASPEHIAQRLQRLEWSTRFRPIHMQALLLGAASPADRTDFLYAPDDTHSGEAAALLAAAGVDPTGKSAEAVLSEFQRHGFYLTHVLECPLEDSANSSALLEKRLPSLFARVRRSLKPKRLILISAELAPFANQIEAAKLDCDVVLDNARPFTLENPESRVRLRDALAVPTSR
jgi:hypothetical protein